MKNPKPDWAVQQIVRETGLIEDVCKHGIGHPNKASIKEMDKKYKGSKGAWGIHGCDGCCLEAKTRAKKASKIIKKMEKQGKEITALVTIKPAGKEICWKDLPKEVKKKYKNFEKKCLKEERDDLRKRS